MEEKQDPEVNRIFASWWNESFDDPPEEKKEE
jgi:hypothetical protein